MYYKGNCSECGCSTYLNPPRLDPIALSTIPAGAKKLWLLCASCQGKSHVTKRILRENETEADRDRRREENVYMRNRWVECAFCHGSGRYHGRTGSGDCSWCDGKGGSYKDIDTRSGELWFLRNSWSGLGAMLFASSRVIVLQRVISCARPTITPPVK